MPKKCFPHRCYTSFPHTERKRKTPFTKVLFSACEILNSSSIKYFTTQGKKCKGTKKHIPEGMCRKSVSLGVCDNNLFLRGKRKHFLPKSIFLRRNKNIQLLSQVYFTTLTKKCKETKKHTPEGMCRKSVSYGMCDHNLFTEELGKTLFTYL